MSLIPSETIDQAAEAIRAGHIVIVPTSRWYMICTAASNEQACTRIFKAKRRPDKKSLVFIPGTIDTVERYFRLNTAARTLADAFWPGDLALLLPWREPADSVHYRAVGSPALVNLATGALGDLALAVGEPLTATSANISGDGGPEDPGPSITIDEVNDFLTKSGLDVAHVIDGGICPAANHTTVIDCFTDEPRLIRTGLVHQRAIDAALRQADSPVSRASPATDEPQSAASEEIIQQP
jgi:L-threonylcarbamoyladenylate synthase